MSKNYVIFSDSGCDLPEEVIKQYKIGIGNFSFKIDEDSYNEKTAPFPINEFYNKMRAGSLTSTSQATPEQFLEAFDEVLAGGKDILYIAFSSGLSGTYNSSLIARDTLLEKYPERKIRIIDSLAASSGYGLLMDKLADLRDEGMGLDELGDAAGDLALLVHLEPEGLVAGDHFHVAAELALGIGVGAYRAGNVDGLGGLSPSGLGFYSSRHAGGGSDSGRDCLCRAA